MIFGVVLCGRLHFCGGLLRTLYRSPDGSLILTWSETHAIFVWARDNSNVHLCSRHQAPSPILDIAWYIIPTAGYEDDAKTSHWCYVISCRDIPVRIVDALRGTVSIRTPSCKFHSKNIDVLFADTGVLWSCESSRSICCALFSSTPSRRCMVRESSVLS